MSTRMCINPMPHIMLPLFIIPLPIIPNFPLLSVTQIADFLDMGIPLGGRSSLLQNSCRLCENTF